MTLEIYPHLSLSKITNFNSDFYETFLFKSRANITCSDLHDAIAVSPDTTCSSTRTWFHMSILTCTNTCSPFVTNINFFLLSLHILRELRYGPN